VILLDTHIWVWWVQDDPRLKAAQRILLTANETSGLGISVISCWEVAKLVEVGRLVLPLAVSEWVSKALAYPGVRLLPLTPKIAIASTQLPGGFHRDPADQILVATARTHGNPLLTSDQRILDYPHVITPS
jgi:PIN domain nuclease of toxin-antitoxin system